MEMVEMVENRIQPLTFADVAEANGWISTDLSAITAVAAGEVSEGFWNCCQERPAMAVEFIREETGEPVWYATCRSCASTVAAERLANLPSAATAVHQNEQSARIARIRAGRELIEAVEVYRQGAPLDMVGKLRGQAIDACARFQAVMGWEKREVLTIYNAMFYASWARDVFAELA